MVRLHKVALLATLTTTALSQSPFQNEKFDLLAREALDDYYSDIIAREAEAEAYAEAQSEMDFSELFTRDPDDLLEAREAGLADLIKVPQIRKPDPNRDPNASPPPPPPRRPNGRKPRNRNGVSDALEGYGNRRRDLNSLLQAREAGLADMLKIPKIPFPRPNTNRDPNASPPPPPPRRPNGRKPRNRNGVSDALEGYGN